MRIPSTWGMVAVLLCGPSAAVAQQGNAAETPPEQDSAEQAEQEGNGADGEQSSEPKTPPYAKKLRAGMRLSAERDFEGAVAALQEAIDLDGKKPAAHYYLGAVRRKQGQWSKAEERFRGALEQAKQVGDTRFRGRALVALADTLERQATSPEAADEGEERAQGAGSGARADVDALEQAREAWTRVLRFAKEHGELVAPKQARARIESIDGVLEQESVYVDVRERIAEREEKNEEESEE